MARRGEKGRGIRRHRVQPAAAPLLPAGRGREAPRRRLQGLDRGMRRDRPLPGTAAGRRAVREAQPRTRGPERHPVPQRRLAARALRGQSVPRRTERAHTWRRAHPPPSETRRALAIEGDDHTASPRGVRRLFRPRAPRQSPRGHLPADLAPVARHTAPRRVDGRRPRPRLRFPADEKGQATVLHGRRHLLAVSEHLRRGLGPGQADRPRSVPADAPIDSHLPAAARAIGARRRSAFV